MICRVATHEQTSGPITSDETRSFRKWLKEQPGFIDGYHAQDGEDGIHCNSSRCYSDADKKKAGRSSTRPGS